MATLNQEQLFQFRVNHCVANMLLAQAKIFEHLVKIGEQIEGEGVPTTFDAVTILENRDQYFKDVKGRDEMWIGVIPRQGGDTYVLFVGGSEHASDGMRVRPTVVRVGSDYKPCYMAKRLIYSDIFDCKDLTTVVGSINRLLIKVCDYDAGWHNLVYGGKS